MAMDHVERLLEVRELRAIVCVVRAVVDCEGADAGRVGSETLGELAGRWGGLLKSSGYQKGKAKVEGELWLPLGGVRVKEEE
jgi:hypothetical protein